MSAFTFAALLTATTFAASPELNRIDPAGAQRGADATFIFRGPRLGDARELLLYEPGITVNSIEVKNGNTVHANVTIAADAPLGEHKVRVRTATGITNLSTFYIGALPSVDEVEPNSTFDQPQAITLGSTVHGTVTNEDVDYFIVDATKGQRISVEVEAMRLGDAMFDPAIAIMDAARFELAASDDTALLVQDSHASVIAPADGKYVVMIREASYGGNNNFRYRMHIGTFPRPTAVYPAGGQVGQTVDLQFIGDPSGIIAVQQTLPAETNDAMPLFAEQDGQVAPSPNYFRVTTLPNVLEVEPNNNQKDATPTDLQLPLAFNGVIEKEGDEDFFRFTATKGQQFSIEVYARRLRSPLDSVINVFGPDGKHIVGDDDRRRPDSQVDFNAPEDGEYTFRVRDHLRGGGPAYVYRVEITPREPTLSVTIPQVEQNRPQERQAIVIPQGGRFATLLRIDREQFGGDVTLALPALPAGVTVHHQPIDGSMGVVPVVFEAAPDAAVAGALTPIIATHTGKDRTITGGFRQPIPLTVGPPNRTEFYATQADKLAVAVAERAPYSIRIVQPAVPIVRDGVMELKIEATRDEGYDEPIRVEMLWNPPGVSSAGSVTINKGQTSATYTLNCNGNAPTRAWQVTLIAAANTPNGQLWSAAPLTELTVADRYLAGTIQMAAATQGEPAAVLVKVEHPTSFEGDAKLELLGLPHGVTAEPISVNKETAEAVFQLTLAGDAHLGTHRGLFCRATVTLGDEAVVGQFGMGGVLRVDKPRPPEVTPEVAPVAEAPKAEEKPQVEAPKPAPPKPLSRLEQLRLERQKQQAGQ